MAVMDFCEENFMSFLWWFVHSVAIVFYVVEQWLRILSKSIHISVKVPNVAHQKMAHSFSKAFVFRVQAGSHVCSWHALLELQRL